MKTAKEIVDAIMADLLEKRPDLRPYYEADKAAQGKVEGFAETCLRQFREALAGCEPPKPPEPVDRSQRELVSGKPEATDPSYREHKENGQQRDFVLTAEERGKGYVRPVRRSYVHQVCGTLTTMSQAIAQTYARDPHFYSGTFCVGCQAHFAVGEDGKFVWADDENQKVGT